MGTYASTGPGYQAVEAARVSCAAVPPSPRYTIWLVAGPAPRVRAALAGGSRVLRGPPGSAGPALDAGNDGSRWGGTAELAQRGQRRKKVPQRAFCAWRDADV